MDKLGGYFGSDEAEDHLDDDLENFGTGREAPPSPVGQDERRMQVRAYNHWASLLGDRRIPIVTDLQPEMLGDFGPYSVLIDLTRGVEEAEIAFLGHELATECGEDAIASLNEVPARSVLSRITDHYLQILANEAPIGFEAEFATDRGAEVQYRGILLPYSSEGSSIDYVYGVINWREVADGVTADELLLEIDQALALDDEAEADAEAVDDIAASPLAAMIEQAYDLAAAEVLGDDGEGEPAPADAVDDTSIYDLEPATMTNVSPRYDMPAPAFGDDEDEDADEGYNPAAYASFAPAAPRASRGVDALGNPIGVPVTDDPQWDGESTGDYDRGIKTAADYGLPDWDDEDEAGDEDDVDGLIDPLSGDSVEVHTSSLMSMVSRGMKHKKTIDLSADVPVAYAADEGAGDDAAATQRAGYASLSPYDSGASYGSGDYGDEVPPVAYAYDAEGYADDEDSEDTVGLNPGYASLSPAEPDWALEDEDDVGSDASAVAEAADTFPDSPVTVSYTGREPDAFAPEPEAEPEPGMEQDEEPVAVVTAEDEDAYDDEADGAAFYAAAHGLGEDEGAPEGLYDALASARVLAQAALTNEDRSRKTLYSAVSQAYDFSLEAQTDPAGYRELIAENGLTMQDRAPMTPIVKLVFGADYDKTRLTEYAAVLTYAHREGVERGGLATYLRRAEGGVKGIVQAERRARREEQGKPVEEETAPGIRDTLAKKLRALEGVAIADVAAGEGEFALVMVRRLKDGALVVLGEVSDDVPLMEKVARKLVA